MTGWIEKQIQSASWLRFTLWFAVLFIFSAWAFNMDSPWTRALVEAGGLLPESQPGFPAIEPERSLSMLDGAKSDYILWQALDIPYAIMNLMVASIGMGLGLKALRLGASPLRFLLLFPMVYVICEIVENSFVALFASGALATSEPAVLLQQLATTVKFASGMSAMALGMLSVVIALIAGLVRLVRKNA
jgi:hypothetical protein